MLKIFLCSVSIFYLVYIVEGEEQVEMNIPVDCKNDEVFPWFKGCDQYIACNNSRAQIKKCPDENDNNIKNLALICPPKNSGGNNCGYICEKDTIKLVKFNSHGSNIPNPFYGTCVKGTITYQSKCRATTPYAIAEFNEGQWACNDLCQGNHVIILDEGRAYLECVDKRYEKRDCPDGSLYNGITCAFTSSATSPIINPTITATPPITTTYSTSEPTPLSSTTSRMSTQSSTTTDLSSTSTSTTTGDPTTFNTPSMESTTSQSSRTTETPGTSSSTTNADPTTANPTSAGTSTSSQSTTTTDISSTSTSTTTGDPATFNTPSMESSTTSQSSSTTETPGTSSSTTNDNPTATNPSSTAGSTSSQFTTTTDLSSTSISTTTSNPPSTESSTTSQPSSTTINDVVTTGRIRRTTPRYF